MDSMPLGDGLNARYAADGDIDGADPGHGLQSKDAAERSQTRQAGSQTWVCNELGLSDVAEQIIVRVGGKKSDGFHFAAPILLLAENVV